MDAEARANRPVGANNSSDFECKCLKTWATGFGLSAQPIEFLERHSKLSKNLEKQRRADFSSTMQWDSDGPSIAVRPAFVTASLSAPHETERQRHALKLARRRARHARFRSCPSEALARGPDAPGRLNQIRAEVQPGPPRACPSARSNLREPGFRLPTSRRLGGKGRPCNRQSPWRNYTARGTNARRKFHLSGGQQSITNFGQGGLNNL